MASLSTEIGELIVCDPDLRGGRPILAGTGISVRTIAIGINQGLSPEQIAAEWPQLSLPQVYAALAHYQSHKAEIDADLQAEAAAYDQAVSLSYDRVNPQAVRFYFDEDLSPNSLLTALRSQSVDLVTSFEAGMNARDDASQLEQAVLLGRVLVSGNVRDFALLHAQWVQQERQHAGIVLVPQQRYPVGEIVRRIDRFTCSQVDPRNGFFYLSNF